jgi:glucose-6-phosphate 1-dehydrogenase
VPKIIMKNAFGRDRASALELNRMVLSVFNENQVNRVDHYLSKETNW